MGPPLLAAPHAAAPVAQAAAPQAAAHVAPVAAPVAWGAAPVAWGAAPVAWGAAPVAWGSSACSLGSSACSLGSSARSLGSSACSLGSSACSPGSSASTKKLSTNCKNVKKTHTAQLTQEIGSTAPKLNLICLYCNARTSLYYKLDELEAMIEDMKSDLIFITESWLHPDIKNAEAMLSGFSEPIRKDRIGRRGEDV